MNTERIVTICLAVALSAAATAFVSSREESSTLELGSAIWDHEFIPNSEFNCLNGEIGWGIPQGSELTDFTGDGKADYLTVRTRQGQDPDKNELLAILKKGNGNGTWEQCEIHVLATYDWNEFSIEWPSQESGIDAADVNGDGLNDLVVFGEGTKGDTTSVTFLNEQGQGFRCAGDVDANGETNVPDLLYLLEDWGCNSNSTR